MFTKNNTMNEILNTEPVGRAAGNLFPTCFMARVPVEHRDHTMAQIEKEETMEWGAPFLADAFLECANLIKETAETKKFKYIPLWGENDDASAGDKMSHWKNGIPDADLNTGCLPVIRLWTTRHLRILLAVIPSRLMNLWRFPRKKEIHQA